ncbi:hypothetical protein CALCODRAFT_491803 [Calocera cornea HHB12733]|uniref:Uncharacterized protein n=1 Tax=Calocera cornea HHB12733 TaxID=1353952 RepID=A0A165IR68_9BASI|nr:hypothetical protein CALCODRAFT_491803 [Calocera cornea HHB12733]
MQPLCENSSACSSSLASPPLSSTATFQTPTYSSLSDIFALRALHTVSRTQSGVSGRIPSRTPSATPELAKRGGVIQNGHSSCLGANGA